MDTNTITLPKGFVLDEDIKPPDGFVLDEPLLPEGFVLDNPAPAVKPAVPQTPKVNYPTLPIKFRGDRSMFEHGITDDFTPLSQREVVFEDANGQFYKIKQTDYEKIESEIKKGNNPFAHERKPPPPSILESMPKTGINTQDILNAARKPIQVVPDRFADLAAPEEKPVPSPPTWKRNLRIREPKPATTKTSYIQPENIDMENLARIGRAEERYKQAHPVLPQAPALSGTISPTRGYRDYQIAGSYARGLGEELMVGSSAAYGAVTGELADVADVLADVSNKHFGTKFNKSEFFRSMSDELLKGADYWKAKAAKEGTSAAEQLIGKVIGGLPGGMGGFMLGTPIATIIGGAEAYKQGGSAKDIAKAAAVAGAKRFALGKIFKAIEYLPTKATRAGAGAATLGGTALMEGAPLPEALAQAVVGGGLSLMGGGRGKETKPIEKKTEIPVQTPEIQRTASLAAKSPIPEQVIGAVTQGTEAAAHAIETPAEPRGGEIVIDPSKTVIVNGTLYHNTNRESADAILKKGFSVEDTSTLSPAERGLVAGNLGDGVYLSPDFNANQNQWGGDTNVAVKPKKPLKLYDLGDKEGAAQNVPFEFVNSLKKAGYDGIIVNDPHPQSGGHQVVVFDPAKVKAKQIVEDSDISDEQLYKIDLVKSPTPSAEQAIPPELEPLAAEARPPKIESALKRIDALDKKQRELEQAADDILKSSGYGQAPPVYHQTLDKVLDIQKKKAGIWNDIRGSTATPSGDTLWQIAIKDKRLPVTQSGKEQHLRFYANDVRNALADFYKQATQEAGKPTGGKKGEADTGIFNQKIAKPITGKQGDLGIAEPVVTPEQAKKAQAEVPTAKFDAQDIYLKKLTNKKEMFVNPANPIPEIETALKRTLEGDELLSGGKEIKPELQKFISDYVTKAPVKNTIFTEERYKKAQDFLRGGGTQGNLFSGVDPRGIKALIEVGGYHFEKGLREFKVWSGKMIEEFGEKVKPHLKNIWNKLSVDIDKIARRDNLKKVEEEIKQHDLYKDTVSERQGRHGYLVGGMYRVGDNMWGDVKIFLESHPELKKNLIKESEYRANMDKYRGVGAWDTALKEAAAAERNPEMEQGGLDTFLNELARRTAGRSKMGRGGIDETDLEATIQKGEEGFNLLADKKRWLQDGRSIDEINKDIREYVEGMGGNEADVKRELLDKSARDVAPREPGQELKTKAGRELDALISNEMKKAAAQLPVFTGNIDKAMAEIVRLKKIIGDSKELVYEPQRKKIKLLEREVARQQTKIDEVKTRRDERIAKIREDVNTRIKGRMETVKRNLDIRHQEELRQIRFRLDRIKEALSQRTTTIQQARNSIKAIMRKLPMEVDTRVDEITDPAEYVKLIEEIKQKVRAKPIREPKAEELDRIDYENLKAEPDTVIEDVKNARDKIEESAKKTFEARSSRIKVIAPKITTRIRQLQHEKDMFIKTNRDAVQEWARGFQKLSKDEKVAFSTALGNGNTGVVNKFLDKYNLRDEYENMQAAKENIRQAIIESGTDVGQIEEHYPRAIKDFDKYIVDYNRYWEDQIKRQEEKLGGIRKLTPDEETALANRLLTTRRFGISTTPASAKHREMKYIPPELVKHYVLADEGIDRYITDAADKIFKAKLLGKEPENIRKVRKQLSNLYTRFSKMADDDPLKLKTGRQITHLQDWLDSRISDTKESVGKFAVEAIKKGELESKDAVELQNVLTSLLEPKTKKMSWLGNKLLNFIGVDTLNMISTAMSQFQGQPISFARHPIIYAKTISGILKRAIAKASGISDTPVFRNTTGSMGLSEQQIAKFLSEQQDWRSGKTKKALMIAIATNDKLDKNIGLEQFYNEFQSAARKGKDNADTEYLKKIFDGQEYRQVLGDFKADRNTTLTEIAIYNRLADAHLISEFEQSQGFAEAGTAGKLFYKFKTAQTKMMNWYYEESIRNIKSGNPILVKEGYKNLFRIPMAMLAANIAVNTVQDWIKGKEISMKDITIDSALQILPFVNRFAVREFRKGGIKGFISSMIPTGRTPEAIFKAISQGQPEQLLKAVPWVGNIPYGQTDVAKMNNAYYSAKDVTDSLRKKVISGKSSESEKNEFVKNQRIQSLITNYRKAKDPKVKRALKGELDKVLATSN